MFTTVDRPGSTLTQALDINDHGQIVGTYEENNGRFLQNHGFLLSAGVFTTFDRPGSVATFATGINDHKQIAGEYQPSGGHFSGFMAHVRRTEPQIAPSE